MDDQTVDRQYATLQQQASQTSGLIQALAQKLQSASAAGDQNAREWQLDLKEIALAVRDEESQATGLLQSIHAMVDNHVQQAAPIQYEQPVQYQPQQPQYAPQPQYQQGGYQQGGGMLHRFLGGGFGQAMASGAGFGIGDDLVQSLFNR